MRIRQLRDACLRQSQRYAYKHPERDYYMHWAVIVQAGKVVEVGVNREGEPPLHFGYRDQSKIHAELSAYKKARGILAPGPFDLINIRLNRLNEPKIAAPCSACYTWLKAVGMRKCWFTTETGWATLAPEE